MASYNEIGYDILEIINNNNISDDEDVSLEQVFYHLAIQRNAWMEKTYNKSGRSIPRHMIQDLGCLELEEVDAADCCDIQVGCTMLRTKKKLPQFLSLHGGEVITRVGPVHKLQAPYTYTSQARAILTSFEKYGSKVVQAFLLNEHMTLVIKDPSMQMLTHINVAGVIADPKDALAFRCDDGESCFSYDEQYPIPIGMLGYIKDQILNQFGVAAKFAKDESNNAKDDITA
tara:strand:- start:199 stop:888 length:690 start_codon:yes stop_codon:yes gene_type:complete